MRCSDWLSLGRVLHPWNTVYEAGRGNEEFTSPEPHGLRVRKEFPQREVRVVSAPQKSFHRGMTSALTEA